MCGRFAYNKEQITPWAKELFKITLDYDSNIDIRPTNTVPSIIHSNNGFIQHNVSWGIKPSWSKKLLFNAQAETVAEKKTFKNSFQNRRCLVPTTGWYEWKNEGDSKKQKYYFSSPDNTPLLMAGIWFEDDDQVVTLTTSPNEICSQVHHRMPLIIQSDCIGRWLTESDVSVLFPPIDSLTIQFTKV